MSISIPYEATGRTAQKTRTRAALVAAAADLVSRGELPTVDAAAQAAGVGRGTAYRYFPNQRALLAAAHPELTTTSLLPPDGPLDPLERLRIVAREITSITRRTEPSLRTMLRLALDQSGDRDKLPLRKGRRLLWVEDALAPLAETTDPARLRATALVIAAAIGIEVHIWLTDIARLDPGEAADVLCWMAEALLVGALEVDTDPPDVHPNTRVQDGHDDDK